MNPSKDTGPNGRNSLLVAGSGVVFAVSHALLPFETFGTVLYAVGALVLVACAIISARINRTDKRVWGGLLVIAVLSGTSQFLSSPNLGADAHLAAEALALAVQVVLVGAGPVKAMG